MTSMGLMMFIFFVLLNGPSAFSQKQILGRVLDKDTNKPINAAKVSFNKTDSLTSTNILGYFQLTAENKRIIYVSREGYEPVEFMVPEVENFQIHLSKANGTGALVGQSELIKYFQRNLVYPEKARNTNTQGRVFAAVDTDSLGQVKNVVIYNDIKERFGKELIKVLKKAPFSTEPGNRSRTFILPINFLIANTKPPKQTTPPDLPEGTWLSEITISAASFVRYEFR